MDEEKLLVELLKLLHKLKKHGVRVIPELTIPEPQLSTLIHDQIGLSVKEAYDKKPDAKISIGKSWTTDFIIELLKYKLSYCESHKVVQSQKITNHGVIEIIREFNFRAINKRKKEREEEDKE